MKNLKNTKPYYTTEKAEGRWSAAVSLLVLFFALLLLVSAWVFLWTKNMLELPVLPLFETNQEELTFIEMQVVELESSQKKQEVL